MRAVKVCGAAFAALLLLCGIFTFTVSAEARLYNMDITVTVNGDGSAHIYQVWDTYIDEGTEVYMPFLTGGYLEIRDLKVRDNTRVYSYNKWWDVDESFEDKAYTCGLNEFDDGFEVCFGISQYGQNRYIVEYTVENMFSAYTDTDGTLFRFVNSEMNFTPTAVNFSMKLANGKPFNDDMANIWGFGYDGDVQFQDGAIVAKTDSDITGSEHMTLMVELNKGVITPARTVDGAFAETKEKAFEDSDYLFDESIWPMVIALTLIGLSLLAGLVGAIIGLVKYISHRIQCKQFEKNCGYHRDLPQGGNLNFSAALGMPFKYVSEQTMLGAHLLRLVVGGYIVPVKEESVGIFGITRTHNNFRLDHCPPIADDGARLYEILQRAAGADGVLSEKELEKYCHDHPQKLRSFIKSSIADGKKEITAGKLFKRKTPTTPKQLRESGQAALAELVGFKKYLEDFSLIDEREVGETLVWQDLMVYAVLLDIADTVLRQLKTKLPEEIEQLNDFDRNIIFTNTYYHCMYNSMRTREQEIAAARSGGSGGSASFGGGGGFSGGGIGGGVR